MFIFSALLKVTAITLPLILICLDYFLIPLSSTLQVLKSIKFPIYKSFKNLTLLKIPFLLISVLFGLINYLSQSSGHAMEQIRPFSLFNRFLLINYSIVNYIYKLFLPHKLCISYPFPETNGNFLPFSFYLFPLFLLIILYFLYKIMHLNYCAKQRKEILFGFLFFIITISLTVNIIPFGTEIISERYTYLPYIGLFFSLCYIFFNLKHMIFKFKRPLFLRTFLLVLLSLYFCFLCITSFLRCKVWESTITLFTDVIHKKPKVAYAYLEIGKELYDKKQYNESLKYLNKAIENRNNYMSAYSLRGIVKNYLGDYYDAIMIMIKS